MRKPRSRAPAASPTLTQAHGGMVRHLAPILLAALAWSPVARAGGVISAEAAVVSDYVDRGISNSDNKPAVQAGATWTHGTGFYAGLWGSSVDFGDGDGATVELDYVLGYAGEAAGTGYDLAAAYVSYPGAPGSLDYDLWEFSAVLRRDLGPLVLGTEAIYTPQNAGKAGDALYLRGMAEVPLAEVLAGGLALAAHLGHQWTSEEAIAGPDYLDWGLGLVWARENVALGVRYSDTDLGHACGRLCDGRVVVEASIAFP